MKECPVTNLTVTSMGHFYDIFAKDCTKGTAIKDFCEKLDTPILQCVCFGDGLNDVTAFQVCPTSVCMKNVPEQLSDIATYHAKTDFGVAEGIRYLFERT